MWLVVIIKQLKSMIGTMKSGVPKTHLAAAKSL